MAMGDRGIRRAILPLVLTLAACDGSSSPAGSSTGAYETFGSPEPVAILGYAGDAMEPFVSRDGGRLFFNDAGPDKDLHWAQRVDDVTFRYQGALVSINTSGVDGVPTLDSSGRFFYVSTGSYSPPTRFDTLYVGTWSGTSVIGTAPVAGLALGQPGFVNFDVEVSPDGATLYFNDGDFRGGNAFPDADELVIAVDAGSGFARHPDSALLLANVNTADLEYAAAISSDGLELFFTRLHLSDLTTRIMRATRPAPDAPFGPPQNVAGIDGFVEGPAFSPDEKSLYYHRRDEASGLFELARVTRP